MTSNKCFLAVDGDDVGRMLEMLVSKGDEQVLIEFIEDVKGIMEEICGRIVLLRGRVIFCAGDSILAEIPYSAIAEISAFALSDEAVVKFSMGVGETFQKAMLSLKAAKASGKGRVMVWSDLL